jgi:hypothetical protein
MSRCKYAVVVKAAGKKGRVHLVSCHIKKKRAEEKIKRMKRKGMSGSYRIIKNV